MAPAMAKLLLLVILALGASGNDQEQSVEDLIRDLHLRLNLMSLEFHEQMEQLVTEQQLLRQSVEKLTWVVDRVDQSMKNVENNHDVVMRNLMLVTSQSNEIMINQQFCANHEALRDLYFETIPRCQGPPLPPTTTERPLTTTEIPPTTTENPAIFKSCRDAPPVSGVYNIMLRSGVLVQVFCEQQHQGGGWLAFQSRLDGSVDFNRSWLDYFRGFGNPGGEYWLGLENLHILTSDVVNLLIIMEDFSGISLYAFYENFRIESESDSYRLSLSGNFEGTAGDSLSPYRFEPFVTFDTQSNSNYGSCADTLASGFWHYDCGLILERNNLNGIYGQNRGQQGIWWGTFGWSTSQNRLPLKKVRMMIREKDTFGLDETVENINESKN